LPLYVAERRAVVFCGMPPYTFWQPNPAVGRIPPHRTDTGAYLVSEVFGTRSMIYVKDEDGLYTADPKKDRHARLIPCINVDELLALDCARFYELSQRQLHANRPLPRRIRVGIGSVTC
jgi:molybdenum storage protein